LKYFKSLFVLLLTGFFTGVSSAAILKGKVTDSSGLSLIYATIYDDVIHQGVVTNALGYYEMKLQPGKYHMQCGMLGYKTTSFSFSITSDTTTIVHDFRLYEQTLEMHEVTFKANAEDPAINIIRQTIARRQYHLNQIRSFQTSLYLKTVLRSKHLPKKFMGEDVKTPDLDIDSNGRGVLYLSEETADYYSNNGRQQTIIHSVRESGDASGTGMAQLPPILSFYENSFNFFSSRVLISPISENAFHYYKFKYMGDFRENGKTIDKIKVTQRREFEPCFNGYLYIAEGDWALHSLDLLVTKEAGLNIFDSIRINQRYVPLKEDEWVINSQQIYVAASILGFVVDGTLAALYNDQKINSPMSDSVFNKKVTSIYDKDAIKQDTAYWRSRRPILLDKDEIRNFLIQDSLNRIVISKAYTDSIRRKKNRIKPGDFLLSAKTFNTRENRSNITVRSLVFATNYNIVEGLNFAPRIKWRHKLDTGKYLNGSTALRYGFSNKHFNNIYRFYYTENDKTWHGRSSMLGLEAGKYVFQYDADNPVFQMLNSLDALFLHENDLKIYERWDANVFAERKYGNGFSWFARVGWQRRIPLNITTQYSFTNNSDGSFSTNLPPNLASITPWEQNDAFLTHLELKYKPGFTYIEYPNYKQSISSKKPEFSLTYDKGVRGVFNSKSDFDKVRLGVRQALQLKLLGTLSYNIATGGFLDAGYVSIPDLIFPYGNRGIGFASPYLESFQFMQYYDFDTKRNLYGEAHIEYKMKGLGTNKLPLFRKSMTYLIFGGNAFYVNNSFYYSEAFAGLDNLGWKAFRLFRIDFVQSWSSMGHTNGIRIGINPSNGMAVSITNSGAETHSEW